MHGLFRSGFCPATEGSEIEESRWTGWGRDQNLFLPRVALRCFSLGVPTDGTLARLALSGWTWDKLFMLYT